MANDFSTEMQIELAKSGIAKREIKTTKAVGHLVKVLVGDNNDLVVVSFKQYPGYWPFANIQGAVRTSGDLSGNTVQPTGEQYEIPLEVAKRFIYLALEDAILQAGQDAADAVHRFQIPEYPVYNYY